MKHYIALVILCCLWILCFLMHVHWIYYLVTFLVFLSFVSWGVFQIKLNWFIKGVHAKKTSKKEIALTFDDGPTIYTEQVLDLLADHRIKATFFCIGTQIEKNPQIFKRIIADGHTIGNHTYSHPKQLGFYNTEKVHNEIKKCDEIIQEYGGIKTTFYRPPFGVTNPNIARAIKLSGKKMVGWSVRSLDTVIKEESKLLSRITKRIQPGSILLLHDTSSKSINVLRELLVILEQQEYTFFQINEL